jgi:DNA-binding SARP family transcriptional activator
MRFQVLGPLEAWEGGRRLALGGPKQRLVLAHLLLRANQVVAADRLIDQVWGEEPPDAARSALQAYVSRLRRSLGPGRLQGRPPGYVLGAAPEEVDVLRFEDLVGQARRRGAAEPRAAVHLLDDALALWRGPALADLAAAPSLGPELARLEELRLAASEERIEALLVLGRHGEVEAELERLTKEHPLRERLWGQRLLALYRSGQQGEALGAYQQARQTLAEELGIDPSPALQRLHQQVCNRTPPWSCTGSRCGATGCWSRSARAPSGRCTGRCSRRWAGRWRSSPSGRCWPTTRSSSDGSRPRPSGWPAWSTRTSSRSTTGGGGRTARTW